jgi:hypothetical protein
VIGLLKNDVATLQRNVEIRAAAATAAASTEERLAFVIVSWV